MEGIDNELDLAIIGMSGEFASAKNITEYWHAIKSKQCLIRNITESEAIARGAVTGELSENYIRKMGALNDISKFNNSKFNVSPKDAEIADPQLRYMFKHAEHALTTSGYDQSNFWGKIGIFGSASISTEWAWNVKSTLGNRDFDLNYLTFVDRDFYLTRIAYQLGLLGPAVLINTACSSSLVAVHIASQSLLAGDCDIALVGACSIRPFWCGYRYYDGGIFSPTGECVPFSSEANGAVPGEGAAFLVIKRIKDAIVDGDSIISVIKSSAINNDGHNKPGYAAPSENGQKNVIESAIELARINVNEITYIECHGTGTKLGDPLEISALEKAFTATGKSSSSYVGSVKANIGHTDVVAGIAGLIKASLILNYRHIPPHISGSSTNPLCHFDDRLMIARESIDLTTKDNVYAAVSSFGVGGTNCHVILGGGNNNYTFSDTVVEESRFEKYLRPYNTPHMPVKEEQSEGKLVRTSSISKAEIISVLSEFLVAGEIDARSRIEDLGIDSIAVVMISEELNEKYGIDVDIGEFIELATVQDLIDGINDKLALTSRHPSFDIPVVVADTSRLTVGQLRYFYPNLVSPAIEAYAHVFEIDGTVDALRLKHAIGTTIIQHQSLRAKFETDSNGIWYARYMDYPQDGYFDVKHIPCPQSEFSIYEYCTNHFDEIDFKKGKLFFARVLHFEKDHSLLMLFSQHVIFDGDSLTIVMQDILGNYRAGNSNRPDIDSHANRSAPISVYADIQYKWVTSIDIPNEKRYWETDSWNQCVILPVDFPVEGVGGVISEEKCERLLLEYEISQSAVRNLSKLNAGVLDIIIYALSNIFLNESNAEFIQLSCTYNGRSGVIGNTGNDFSRTVGALAMNGLLIIRNPSNSDPKQGLADVKQQLSDIPNKGLSYFFKELQVGLGSLNEQINYPDYDRQIGINFFGYNGFCQTTTDTDEIRYRGEYKFPPPERERWYKLEFEAGFADGQLFVQCRFSDRQYREETIQYYLKSVLDTVRLVANEE